MTEKFHHLWLSPGVYDTRLTPDKLIRDYCKLENTTLEELGTKSRERLLKTQRQVIMRLLKNNFPTLPLRAIGSYFDRDHATVLHACKTIGNFIDTDRNFRAGYNLLLDKLTRMNSLKERLRP